MSFAEDDMGWMIN